MLKNGYIQVYTGDGKGKTTAAIGQGIRAYGNGLKVVMVQFLKSGKTGELNTIKDLNDNFSIHRFEKKRDFVWNLNKEEIEELKLDIKVGYQFIKDIIEKNKCDLLIVDEMLGVISNGFLLKEEVLYILDRKPEEMEIILTGRNIPDYLEEKADLVTEMKCRKHYFEKGVNARKGIEF